MTGSTSYFSSRNRVLSAEAQCLCEFYMNLDVNLRLWILYCGFSMNFMRSPRHPNLNSTLLKLREVSHTPKDGSDLAATEKKQLFQRKAPSINKETTITYHCRIFRCILKIIPSTNTFLVTLPPRRSSQALFSSFISHSP